MSFVPFCSTEIFFAAFEQMKAKLLGLDAKNVVVIINESAIKRWQLQNFMADLKTKYETIWLNQSIANPTQSDILFALKQINKRSVDVIIAFGGGSAIDLAKGISAFHDSEKVYTYEEITQAIKEKTYKNKANFIDIIAVPSTAGTGSEVTQWATIWDAEKSGKYSLDVPELKPKLALIVPELTLTLSPKMTIVTGLDALSHGVEAYWSKHTTPIVQEIAYRAVAIIVEDLKSGVQKPDDLAVRERLCRASVLAGLAFSQTRTTACHSISYPLTMLYDMPHGLAAAITLEAVGEINKGRFANDSRLFDLFEDYGGIFKWMEEVCEGIIPLRLSAFNIKETDVKQLVNRSFTGGRMDNNPVDLNKEDVTNILLSIL